MSGGQFNLRLERNEFFARVIDLNFNIILNQLQIEALPYKFVSPSWGFFPRFALAERFSSAF